MFNHLGTHLLAVLRNNGVTRSIAMFFIFRFARRNESQARVYLLEYPLTTRLEGSIRTAVGNGAREKDDSSELFTCRQARGLEMHSELSDTLAKIGRIVALLFPDVS